MDERGLRVEVACFEGVWTNLDGLRLLLLREKGRKSLNLEIWEALKLGAAESSIDPDAVLNSLKKISELTDLKRECDFGHVELSINDTRLSLIFTGRRAKCLPLTPLPDRVSSVELLLKGADSDVPELDAMQRSVLTRRSFKLGEDLYAVCLVGEILDPNIVALGMELLNSGYRTILAEELKQTYVEERPERTRPERPKRRSKKRRKKRKRRGS